MTEALANFIADAEKIVGDEPFAVADLAPHFATPGTRLHADYVKLINANTVIATYAADGTPLRVFA